MKSDTPKPSYYVQKSTCHCLLLVPVLNLSEVMITLLPLHMYMFHVADFQHKITVQASPSMDKRRSLHSTSSSPPSSPTLIPRLRAIQRGFRLFFLHSQVFHNGKFQIALVSVIDSIHIFKNEMILKK